MGAFGLQFHFSKCLTLIKREHNSPLFELSASLQLKSFSVPPCANRLPPDNMVQVFNLGPAAVPLSASSRPLTCGFIREHSCSRCRRRAESLEVPPGRVDGVLGATPMMFQSVTRQHLVVVQKRQDHFVQSAAAGHTCTMVLSPHHPKTNSCLTKLH